MSAFKPLPGAQLNLDHPLAQGLVGCWLLNENSGNKVHDYSGQNNEGTLSGFNDPPIATSGWNAGPHGGALAFDGVNDYVDCGNAAGIGFDNTQNNTICLSVKGLKADNVANTRLLSKSTGALYNYEINVENPAVAVRAQTYDGTNNIKVTFGDVLDGYLHYLVAVFNRAGNLTTYNDGKLVAASNISMMTNSNNMGILSIGGFAGTSYFFNGFISSTMIYNRALSAEEIAYLYAFPFCFFEEAPIWQSFDPYRAQRAMNHYRQMRAA